MCDEKNKPITFNNEKELTTFLVNSLKNNFELDVDVDSNSKSIVLSLLFLNKEDYSKSEKILSVDFDLGEMIEDPNAELACHD